MHKVGVYPAVCQGGVWSGGAKLDGSRREASFCLCMHPAILYGVCGDAFCDEILVVLSSISLASCLFLATVRP